MRRLEMKYAGGGIVRHLGLQNYKGAVPALAELIANAWDADANNVEVIMPLDRPISKNDEIIIRDDGNGMSFNDCDEKYLVIARNRRDAENTDRTPGGRPLMAHKGLGKLAGFGIAKIVEVKTVQDGKITHFQMSFHDLDKLAQGEPYYPKLLDDGLTNEKKGTEIRLKDLTLVHKISRKSFRQKMAQRFSIYSDSFKVSINEKLIKRRHVPTQFRFPEGADGVEVKEIDSFGYGITTLENGETIKWWIGFSKDTIKDSEYSGVSVLARGRVAQDPWNFNLAGGTWGDHGLRYMTGEIIAEFVDEGLHYETDTILTNRSGLNWEHIKNKPLYDWAQKKIKRLLRTWSDKRGKQNVEDVRKKNPKLVDRIDRFPVREKKEINQAIKSIAQIPTMKTDRLAKIADHVLRGYEDKAFRDVMVELQKLPPEDCDITLSILEEFDVFEAIRVHSIVSSHVGVIRRFEEMIKSGAKEKPDMQEYIKKYPWLLGIEHQTLDHEKTLQTILETNFGIDVSNQDFSKKRPDFFVMKKEGDILVIELKRPGEKIGQKEILQTRNYVYYLREWIEKGNTESLTGIKFNPKNIVGYLIGYDIVNTFDVKGAIQSHQNEGLLYVCKWTDLLMKANDGHQKYLSIIKRRAPQDDPRLMDIS